MHIPFSWPASLYRRAEPTSRRQCQLLDALNEAKRDWLAAESYFKIVSEPELVDHAIFLVEAAKRRYEYLLRLARQENISAYQ
ncbi:MAG TPA: DUF2508 family protein [Firmicutes bacterium]|nr:DUF2508 family protein [Bacillota bacterium]